MIFFEHQFAQLFCWRTIFCWTLLCSFYMNFFFFLDLSFSEVSTNFKGNLASVCVYYSSKIKQIKIPAEFLSCFCVHLRYLLIFHAFRDVFRCTVFYQVMWRKYAGYFLFFCCLVIPVKMRIIVFFIHFRSWADISSIFLKHSLTGYIENLNIIRIIWCLLRYF